MRVVFLAIFAFVSTSLFAQPKVSELAKFSTENYNFGKIKQGVPVTATITVTNISKEPLIIEQASPSCGCTVSDYTKEPIAPGKTGTIKAVFDAKALGPINKTITVKLANAQDVKFVKLSGEVLDATAYAKQKGSGK
ncbi:MAG: DUF1573 domain-containing protein [Chitinophagaceae bacterium]|nr:DUF1573 domain-containing protein [Chitinophagaceae bacterium]